MSQGQTVPRRILNWLTTRPFAEAEQLSDFAWNVYNLEHNDWTGTNEEGEAIVWDGFNFETCTREHPSEWDEENEEGYCSQYKREEVLAQDLSLIHVYFKDTHIRKYLKEQNFGLVDAIGN